MRTILVFLASVGLAAAEPLTIELPPDTTAFRPGTGVELAQAYCFVCHSTEYIATQPAMPRKFWETSVKKMKEKFAATLPEDTTALVDYLTQTYGKP
jgi:mono/diheme cytochrome c family protein